MQFMFAALKLELGDTLYYLLIFAALLLLVKHFAWGPVTKMMEKRRQKVISDLDQAESDRKKAALLANQREAALKDSKQEATQILSTAKSNAEKTKSSSISQAYAKKYGFKKLILTNEVDSSILGGIILKVGDRIIDGSIRTRLQQIREQLIENR